MNRQNSPGYAPLAARVRPGTLEEFVGQSHIAAPGRLLRRAIQADQLSSIIFHGPPGTGKTTLAMVIANTTRSRFIPLNAVLSGVKDLGKPFPMRAGIGKKKTVAPSCLWTRFIVGISPSRMPCCPGWKTVRLFWWAPPPKIPISALIRRL